MNTFRIFKNLSALCLSLGCFAHANAAKVTAEGWWGVDTVVVSPLADAKTPTSKLELRMADGSIFKLQKDGSVVSSAKAVLSPAVACSFKWETGSDGVTPALRYTGKGRYVELYYIEGNGSDTIATAKSTSLENVLKVGSRKLSGPYPRRIIDSKETGSVTVDILMTKAGYVEGVSIVNAKGVTNPHVRNEILSDALHLRFAPADADQHGTIVYTISADDYNAALAARKKQEMEERRRLHREEAIRQNANSKVANAFSTPGTSFELEGRKLAKAMPRPVVSAKVDGWVEIKITVDNEGNVTNATLGRRSKDLNDEAVFNKAIETAKDTKFNAVTNSDMPNQLGIITYHFISKK